MSGAVTARPGPGSAPRDGSGTNLPSTGTDQEVTAASPVGMVRAMVDDLSLPLPTRTRLIRELTQDLDGFTRRLVARGVPVDEARRRAIETMIPDATTLAEIEAFSLPLYRRLTRRLQPSWLRRAERASLVLATGALLAVETATLLRTGLLDDPSPFLWPVLALGAMTLSVVLAKAFQLGVKGQHRHPRRELRIVDGLAVLTLSTAVLGVLVDLIGLATTMEATPAGGHEIVTAWVVRDAALLSTGIILAVTGALGRFGLSTWITHMEHRYLQALRTQPESPFHNEELES